jgi:hypothetical protein
MKHAVVVGEVDGERDRPKQRQRLLEIEVPLTPEQIGQGPSPEKLHDQVRNSRSSRVHAEIRDVDDVAVLQPAERSGLDPEAALELGVVSVDGTDELERKASLESDVPGLVDQAHPSLAEAPVESILPVDHSAAGQGGDQRDVVGGARVGPVVAACLATGAFLHGSSRKHRPHPLSGATPLRRPSSMLRRTGRGR